MKKIIFIYAGVFPVWFGLLWFDSLLQIPFAVVIFAGLIHSIWFPVKVFRAEKERGKRWLSLLPVLFIALAITIQFLPLQDWKVRTDHHLFKGQRMNFIKDIGNSKPSVSEAVRLPHWWLSCNGTAKVFCRGDIFLVEFPVTSGLLSGSWSVVYSEWDTPPTAEDLLCGKVEIQEKLSPHWYYLHAE